MSNAPIRTSNLSIKKHLDGDSFSISENVSSHNKSPYFTIIVKSLKIFSYYNRKYKKIKDLVEEEGMGIKLSGLILNQKIKKQSRNQNLFGIDFFFRKKRELWDNFFLFFVCIGVLHQLSNIY